MRHHNNNRKFGRTKNQRNALLKGLVLAMISHGRVETTLAKARELRPIIEKLITLAKKGDQASHRLIVSRIYGRKSEANKLVNEIASKYKDREGGYTRITKLGARQGDASQLAVIELV